MLLFLDDGQYSWYRIDRCIYVRGLVKHQTFQFKSSIREKAIIARATNYNKQRTCLSPSSIVAPADTSKLTKKNVFPGDGSGVLEGISASKKSLYCVTVICPEGFPSRRTSSRIHLAYSFTSCALFRTNQEANSSIIGTQKRILNPA